MPYARTAEQKAGDFARSKEFEAEVAAHLPQGTVVRTDSTSELDFFVPGLTIEVKEKRQRLTDRWRVTGWAEADTFILDELTVRKALKLWPWVWFVLRDVPGGDRIFLASVAEVISADRVRWDRNGKGKWVISLAGFRQVPLDGVMDAITDDVLAEAWKRSSCVTTAPEVD